MDDRQNWLISDRERRLSGSEERETAGETAGRFRHASVR